MRQLGNSLEVPNTEAIRAFEYKIDLYLRRHVFSRFEPADVTWFLSLSGGKDSFAMAVGLRNWYARHSFRFNAHLFTIDQWGGEAPQSIGRQIPWASVHTIDARERTVIGTNYTEGQQAPCRACADVRRLVTDDLVKHFPGVGRSRRINVVARGLHLTDTCVSMLWRFALGRNPNDRSRWRRD